MTFGMIAAFWAVSFLLVLTPGADWAYAITAGLRYRSVLPAVSGLLAGYLAITVVVAAGAAALITSTPGALTVLTLAGAAYLGWLGITTLLNPPTPQSDSRSAQSSWLGQAGRGALISGFNPKALLLFLALLPQFTDPSAGWPLTAQLITLGCLHMAMCGVVYGLVGTGSKVVLRARPAAARFVARCSGVAMTAIGAGLLVEQFLRL
ncbi:LysE family translocator [Kineosporia sp. J2-2]|uniref:LysE family translocator n=1 Tax=Kineosporia corallincola TaxID=2835133 RepID=A0ABS5TME7_9ACTN|nr:LysE family translocator [Kineosporia corallincola]MBT0772276.1 LysE family translocator [Kineosporia corallincola]